MLHPTFILSYPQVGEGRIITIHDSESPPPYPVMTNMNFSPDTTSILSSLNWATADEEYTPILPPSEVTTTDGKSERQKSRLSKRKAMTNHLYSTRQELFDGEFDGYDLLTYLRSWKKAYSGTPQANTCNPI
jgi:tRNA (adenine-N(1)-)-methyltransferase non-catalytic subunit